MSENKNSTIDYLEGLAPHSYMALVRDILEQRYPTPPLAYVHSYGCPFVSV